MIPTVATLQLRRRAQLLGGQRDQTADRPLHDRHHGLVVPATVDLGGDVAAVGEPELRAARVDERERFDGRAGLHHLQVDVLAPVVASGQRPVDPRVHRVGGEVEDQRRLRHVRQRIRKAVGRGRRTGQGRRGRRASARDSSRRARATTTREGEREQRDQESR